ncbi:MAG: ABC-F family ATP-binding cassette domain-containing protein [Bacteroidales bacterium]|nr:ABC-F family ATP-binding cassette domain-containing protein [Candidatus Cryptobacteroides aphodequi]
MPSFLQIDNISKSYGTKVLFENIGFNINEGDKIALVAPNGTGKSTLLRILAGEDRSDSGGRILFLKDISIAFLSQEYPFDPALSIRDQILSSTLKFFEGKPSHLRDSFVLRMNETASNFRLNDLDRKMGELSGGEIKRVALTQMLALDAEFLIMDEPTNHLDIEAIEYLEAYLGRKRCTLLMVTHDRYFLDRVCNTVMELDHGAVYTYRGNYQNYLEKRDERISNYNAQTDKVRNLLRRELEWIHATPCARSGKAKYRIDAFHALSERASQVYVSRQVNMEGAGEASRLGTKIIDCHHVGYCLPSGTSGTSSQAGGGEPVREGRCLLKDFDYRFQRYEKVGIVGRNGIGKTTFLNFLTGDILPTEGVIERGESLKIGYYRQRGIDFDGDDTVLDVIGDTRLLNRFLFPREMLNMPVARLSGGEKRRLYLLSILMQNPNLLILDEPTNDLDIVTLNILEEYLLEFGGSLIIVSHDRHFMDRIADHLLVFTGDGGVKDFNGSFSEYRSFIKDLEAQQKSAERAAQLKSAVQRPPASVISAQGDSVQSAHASSAKGASTAVPSAQSAPAPKKKKLSFKEQRELEGIEKRLPELETEKSSLEAAMSAGTLSYEELRRSGERIQEIIAETDTLEMRWLELTDIG